MLDFQKLLWGSWGRNASSVFLSGLTQNISHCVKEPESVRPLGACADKQRHLSLACGLLTYTPASQVLADPEKKIKVPMSHCLFLSIPEPFAVFPPRIVNPALCKGFCPALLGGHCHQVSRTEAWKNRVS